MHLKSILNVVSSILIAHGVLMFFPIIVSYIYDDSLHNSFLFSALITLSINLFIFIFTKKNINFSIKDAFATVTLTWFFVALFSTLPFLLSGTINNFTDAFFESMSGVSTTGATIITITKDLPNGIESLPHSILFWRSFTQWIGGMGIIVFSIAVLPLLGVGGIKLFRAEVPGPITQKIKPRIKDTAKILWMIYISFTIFQILLLSLAGMPWFDSICHAFTTMPTGGFSTQNSSINSYSSPIIQYIFIFFMFMAGINFSLHFKVINIGFKSYFKDFEFRIYTFLILIFSILIFINISFTNSEWTHNLFLQSLFQTISIITTTGYTNANYELWPFFSQLLIFFMMFLGAMGGSTSGGLKISRIIVLIKYSLNEIRRMVHSRAIIPTKIGDNLISEEVVRNTLGFFLIYISIFIFTSLVLTLFNLDLITSIGVTASAIGNIGPALGDFGPTDSYASLNFIGKWILSFCMLLGRLEIFTVLVFINSIFFKKYS